MKTQSIAPSKASPPTSGTAIVASGVIDDVTAVAAGTDATTDGATEAAIDEGSGTVGLGVALDAALDPHADRINTPTASPIDALTNALEGTPDGRRRYRMSLLS